MKRKFYQRRTTEEKREQVEQLLTLLDEGVKNFQYSPENYKAMLEMQALMPTYSFRNIMLAKKQLPNAKFLASFKRWKELGRYVIKGEKAIRILAPRFKKIENEDGEEEEKLIGFIAVPVFDYSQTDGEPLPIEKAQLKLQGDSEEAAKIFEWVKKIAGEDGCLVQLEKIRGFTNGYYHVVEHRIVINETLPLNHRAKTAVHELVHSRVHKNLFETTEEEREIVAEGTAYIVCTYFGLDTSDYSFGYIKNWYKDNGESLMKYGGMIQKTALSLIKDFERVSERITLSKEEFTDEEAIGA